MPNPPLVSVIVPAYNMARFTRLTVESLLAQTHPRMEIIVVDDGSTDGTAAEMESFGDRIRLIRQENAGACRARNRGFSESKGEFVAFLDCDDLWEPRKAERCLEHFREHPGLGMVYSHAYWIDEAGGIVGPPDFRPRPSGEIFNSLILEDHIINSTPLLKRRALEEAGLWDEEIFTTADWDLWLRVADRFEIGFIPEVLSRTRIVSHYNRRNIERTRRETLYVLDKYRDRTPAPVRAEAEANMHFYLSRLHAANGDFAGALREVREAARLRPGRLKFHVTALAYALGRPLNLVLSRLWQCYTLLSCRWNIRRQGAEVHPRERE